MLEGVTDITKVVEDQSIALEGPRTSHLGAYKSDELGFKPRAATTAGVKSREDLRRMASESQQQYANKIVQSFESYKAPAAPARSSVEILGGVVQ